MQLSLPLLLTLFRIVVIPVIVWIYLSEMKYGNWYNTILFVLAAISDGLDGYFARKWQQVTKLGAFLDPVADKLLIATTLILIVTDAEIRAAVIAPWFFILVVVVIIGREITISALREWMAEIGKRAKVKVSLVGKYKTAIQMTAIGFLLFKYPLFGIPVLRIGEVLLYIAGVLTLWSMCIYLMGAYRALRADQASVIELD